ELGERGRHRIHRLVIEARVALIRLNVVDLAKLDVVGRGRHARTSMCGRVENSSSEKPDSANKLCSDSRRVPVPSRGLGAGKYLSGRQARPRSPLWPRGGGWHVAPAWRSGRDVGQRGANGGEAGTFPS